MNMRQLIIARKDLQMSPGKLAAQVSHASMAFISSRIRADTYEVRRRIPFPSFIIDSVTGEKRPREYSHPDLKVFAIKAFNDGDDYFTCRRVDPAEPFGKYELCENEFLGYVCGAMIDKDTYEQWFCGSFTKTICEAKNRNQLMKAADLAKVLGLQEGLDFFLIRDNCLTELEPEEIDENGVGRTLTCIGFRPLPDDLAHQISRKYQLYK